MVGSHPNRFLNRPWPVVDDYSDEEDYAVDFYAASQTDYHQLLHTDAFFQDDIAGRMASGERFAEAYDHVTLQHCTNTVDRLGDELQTLEDTVSRLDTEFAESTNTWAAEDHATYMSFENIQSCAWLITEASNRVCCILSWFHNTPTNVASILDALRVQYDLIARKRFEIDDTWRWYHREPLHSVRDPWYDQWWSCIWGDDDVRFGDDLNLHPNGFHDFRVPEGPADENLREFMQAAWHIRNLRLIKATTALIANQGTIYDFVIPSQVDVFQNSLIAFIDSLGDGRYELTEADAIGWSNLRDDVEESRESRIGYCDYDVQGNLYLADTVYRVEKSPSVDGRYVIIFEKKPDVVKRWFADHEHIPGALEVLTLPQLQEGSQSWA